MPTTDHRLLFLHARGGVLGGTPGGGHGAARSRCAARPRNGRRTETAADMCRTRQAMDRCTVHASAYTAYTAYSAYNVYNAYNAYNDYNACSGRAARCATRSGSRSSRFDVQSARAAAQQLSDSNAD